jgi:hypothetical protein
MRAKLTQITKQLRAETRARVKAEEALKNARRPVFADPVVQFAHDLWLAWLKNTEEGDRKKWPLRRWDLSEQFLDSIAAQQIVDYDRAVKACVDVVTGRHAEINSRQPHRLRASGGKAGSDYRVRPEDGAAAWRCWINQGPSAARLMWWERCDDVVELSLVCIHDDVRIA